MLTSTIDEMQDTIDDIKEDLRSTTFSAPSAIKQRRIDELAAKVDALAAENGAKK